MMQRLCEEIETIFSQIRFGLLVIIAYLCYTFTMPFVGANARMPHFGGGGERVWEISAFSLSPTRTQTGIMHSKRKINKFTYWL